MKLNNNRRNKILDIVKGELDSIAETLIEKEGCSIEDTIEQDSVFLNADGIVINYSAEGFVKTWEFAVTSESPGEYGEQLTFDVHIESVEWFEPNEEEDISHYICAEDIDKLNKSLENLYYDNIRLY